jgi:hypothetical protein
MLVGADFLAAEDDVFYLRRNEITDVLWDFFSSWAVGAHARGPSHWPQEIGRRKDILRCRVGRAPVRRHRVHRACLPTSGIEALGPQRRDFPWRGSERKRLHQT